MREEEVLGGQHVHLMVIVDTVLGRLRAGMRTRACVCVFVCELMCVYELLYVVSAEEVE